MSHGDIRVAAFFLVGLFVLGKKFEDSPCAGGDHNYAAAEPREGRAVIGILDNF